jgi:pyruvate formate lyase activating enzyme
LGTDVPLHFSAFHPDWKMLNTQATPPSTLVKARQIALRNGILYAYVGNVHNKEGDSTWCHQCGHLLIGRDWYELSEWNLTAEGKCQQCGAVCSGVFEEKPGDWGARSKPVEINTIYR